MAYRNYGIDDGRLKIQIEDLLPQRNYDGWIYQKPGAGIPKAEGATYYYKTNDKVLTHHYVPDTGRFGFTVDVEDAGAYQILIRAARTTNADPKHRNDIWVQVDGDTAALLPEGTKPVTEDHGGKGFVKLKGAQTTWVNAHMFSADDANPESIVMLDEGRHTFVFAPRSTGYHIDSLQLVQRGATPPADPDPERISASIAAQNDDYETTKLGRSLDLDLGRDGKGAQSTGLRFSGLDIPKGAEIESAYLVFEASERSVGSARFTIEIEDTAQAKTYSRASTADDRGYLDDEVAWTPGEWRAGETYKSADISDLIEAIVGSGGLDALDALAFRIQGEGQRVAHAFESDGAAPKLVIDYL